MMITMKRGTNSTRSISIIAIITVCVWVVATATVVATSTSTSTAATAFGTGRNSGGRVVRGRRRRKHKRRNRNRNLTPSNYYDPEFGIKKDSKKKSKTTNYYDPEFGITKVPTTVSASAISYSYYSSYYKASKKSKSKKSKSKKAYYSYYGTDEPTTTTTTEEVPSTDLENETEESISVDVSIDENEADDSISVDGSSNEENEEDVTSTTAVPTTTYYYNYYTKSDKKAKSHKKEKSDKKSKEIKNSYYSYKSEKEEKSLKSSITTSKSWKSEKSWKSAPAIAPTPSPVGKSPTPSPIGSNSDDDDDATCAASPFCPGLGLTGDCCPTIEGKFLDCCTTPVDASCSAAPFCQKLSLTGDCCPTNEGTFLDCCTIDEKVFVPEELWTQTLDDVVDETTGFLFYDPVTKFAWYAYTADGRSSTAATTTATARMDDETNATTTTTARLGGLIYQLGTNINNVETYGRMCPLDTQNNGKIMENLCLTIRPPTTSTPGNTATSTSIQSVEACYGGGNNGSTNKGTTTTTTNVPILKVAVIVRDDATGVGGVNNVVCSRLIVYDMILAGSSDNTNNSKDAIDMEVAYQGWTSMYGEPRINGRPAFSNDCQTVYATWLKTSTTAASTTTTTKVTTTVEQEGEEDYVIVFDIESENEKDAHDNAIGKTTSQSTMTIATALNGGATSTSSSTGELWRFGSTTRFVGFTPSQDGTSLFSATHVPMHDHVRTGGMVQLDSTTGQILQEYAYDNDDNGMSHNAYTNVIVDDNDQTYHIDSIFGLTKFNGNNLKLGPIWKATDSDTTTNNKDTDKDNDDTSSESRNRNSSNKRTTTSKRDRRQLRPLRNSSSKNIFIGEETIEKKPIMIVPQSLINNHFADDTEDDHLFTAYQPALNQEGTIVYSCSANALDNNKVGDDHGVMASKSQSGESVWFTPIKQDVIDVLDAAVMPARTANSAHTAGAINLGACSGITGDIQWAPSFAASLGHTVTTTTSDNDNANDYDYNDSDNDNANDYNYNDSDNDNANDYDYNDNNEKEEGQHDGIYIARGSRIECLDSTNGTLLWTYQGESSKGDTTTTTTTTNDKDASSSSSSKFVVVSDRAVVVATGGTIVSLQTTTERVVPTAPPSPIILSPTVAPITLSPTVAPTDKPNSPIALPSPPPTTTSSGTTTTTTRTTNSLLLSCPARVGWSMMTTLLLLLLL